MAFLFFTFCHYLLVTVRNYQKSGKFYVYCFCGGFALNRDIFRIFVNIKKCTVLEWLCHSFMRNSAQEPCKYIILPMCMRRIRVFVHRTTHFSGITTITEHVLFYHIREIDIFWKIVEIGSTISEHDITNLSLPSTFIYSIAKNWKNVK